MTPPREKGSDLTQHLCVCGSPLSKGAERGQVCSDCEVGEQSAVTREQAAAVSLRELGS